MWPRTELQDLFGIEHPIVQAPMAGSDSPELAAAVSNAGGLGSMGLGPRSPEQIREKVAALKALTNRAFNLNFFVHDTPRPDPDLAARTVERLRPIYAAYGAEPPPPELEPPYPPFDAARLETVLELRPAVVSFHFGLPPAAALARLKDAGCRLIASATTVAEGRAVEAAGLDAVIAQGWEAGGHRGSFAIEDEEQGVGTMALVPQIVDAVSIPVIAAGGIGDARGIAAAFALGAAGVQMGTAFLHCPESAVADAHRDALRTATDTDTRHSRGYSGRAARGRSNAYVEALAAQRERLPDYPLMYEFSGPLIAAAKDKGENLAFMLYGQAAALGRPLPAGELLRQLAKDALGRIGRPA
jgi:nitronate monooxygenase